MRTDKILNLEMRTPLDLIRKTDSDYIERLTEYIREHGITEPIAIRTRGDGTQIVWDGLHRLIVAVDLGIEEIPVLFI